MIDCVSDSFRKGALEHIVKSRPKMALFTKLAQLDEETERYTAENEVRGLGYQGGGVALEGGVVLDSEAGFVLVFHSPVWQNATITARGALVYMADDGGRAVRVIDFGRDVTSTNGDFTVKMPEAADGGVISL